MLKLKSTALQVALIGSLFAPHVFAQDSSSEIVHDDLITSSNQTTPWQVCGTDAPGIDPTLLNTGGCAFRTTPVLPNTTYRMTCAVSAVKFASITLAFHDADDVELASETTEIFEDQVAAFSVTLQSPATTTTGAIGIYGEAGSGFQDCVLVDVTPAPEPTKGSIAGTTFFDDNADGNADADDASDG